MLAWIKMLGSAISVALAGMGGVDGYQCIDSFYKDLHIEMQLSNRRVRMAP
jgi:hypothetical protein